jgi:hypothetical protein
MPMSGYKSIPEEEARFCLYFKVRRRESKESKSENKSDMIG